jgi:single-strand DNA-binding protein
VNRVEIVGTLVRDPDLRAIPSGAFVCEFSLVWREAFWDRDAGQDAVRSHYFGCVAWGEVAEAIGENYRRGDELYVLGELTQQKVPGKDGKAGQSKTKVRVQVFRPVRKRSGVMQPETDAEGNIPAPF